MIDLLTELRQAARGLRRSPGFTALAGITLALAFGANTAIFSLVEGVLLRPLPFADPGSLVTVWTDLTGHGGGDRVSVAPASLTELRRAPAFTGLAAQWASPFTLPAGSGDAESVGGAQVSPEFFRILGVPAFLGRTFSPEDGPAEEPGVVLSHALWRRRFGGDPKILGQKLTLNEQPYTVIGVMPPRFRVPLFLREPQEATDLWVPLHVPPPMNDHGARILQVIGRLAPGRTLRDARSEIAGIVRHLDEEAPDDWHGVGVAVVPLTEQIVGRVRPVLLVLQVAVGLLLLIACVNLANLSLARAVARGQEMTLRAALGAGRWRLARLALAESLLLALLGGAAGLVLGVWGTRLLVAVAPPETPRLQEVGFDAGLAAFGLALSLAAGFAVGLVPALRAARAHLKGNLQGSLAEGGRRGSPGAGQSRLRDALLVAQVALTLLLLIAAGLLERSFLRLRAVDPGFQAGHVLTLKVALPPRRYPEPAQQARFFEGLFRQLGALPGVTAAGGITRLPLDTGWGAAPVVAEGMAPLAGGTPQVGFRRVTSGYFQALSIPLRAGRGFSAHDDGKMPPVVLINETMARRFWPGQEAVGRRVRIAVPDEPWREVVGVVGDVVYDSLASAPMPEMFVPHTQIPSDWFQLVIRAKGDPLALAGAVRETLRTADRDLPAAAVRPLAAHVAESLARPRFSTFLLGGFAVAALLLSAFGVFGLTAYTVAQRTREVGIRMALGARREEVVVWIVARSLRLVGCGIAAGLIAGALAARSLASQLFGVSAADPVTFVCGPLFLAAVALAASYLPARRSAGLDPMMALRAE